MQSIVFKNFVTLQRGFDLPKNDMKEGNYPVVGSTSIIGHHNEYKVEPPGVITGRSGSLGQVQYIDEPYWPHNTALWVRDFKGNHPKYVYYILKTLDLARFNAGAGVPTLNRNHLDELEISIHEPDNQRRISDILSAYDNLIENNIRRIRILEKMAYSIYHEWFGIVGKESLPKGWELKSFSELVDIDPITPVDKQIEKPFVGMNALSESSMIINLDLVEIRTGSSGAKFQNRDVLFPRITPSVENGKGAFVQFLKNGQVA
ncbi:MAG TPA: restriction endonuclease subunit S, partial [Anaerolineales bacterium]|nr:restriction endonuclease subunit S [Anaerolineales bacterium]